jgi:hypothetical protein
MNMIEFDPNSYLIPIGLVTGAPTIQEATLMLAYRGVGVVLDPKNKRAYLPLPAAIRWNETEAEDSDSHEREFRLALVDELKSINSPDAQFKYSERLMGLRNRVFAQ